MKCCTCIANRIEEFENLSEAEAIALINMTCTTSYTEADLAEHVDAPIDAHLPIEDHILQTIMNYSLETAHDADVILDGDSTCISCFFEANK